MKQKMILTVCLAVLGMLSVKAQQSIIALHHQGNVTIFAGGELQKAIDASEKGDTLYLSDGVFSGGNLDHGLVVLGSGQNTKVGGLTITSNDSTEVKGGFVFSGLHILEDFTIDSNVDGFLMKHCNIEWKFVVKGGRNLRGSQIIQSRIRWQMLLDGNEYGLTVLNSCVYGPEGGGVNLGNVSFINCNVLISDGKDCVNNIFQNCFHKNYTNGTFINCALSEDEGTEGGKNIVGNYWWYSWSELNGENSDVVLFDSKMVNNQLLTAEQIKELGWIGSDGTIIGCMGGNAPYTLEIDEPHVTGKNIVVDNDERKITVTLKVESGESSESSQEGQ